MSDYPFSLAPTQGNYDEAKPLIEGSPQIRETMLGGHRRYLADSFHKVVIPQGDVVNVRSVRFTFSLAHAHGVFWYESWPAFRSYILNLTSPCVERRFHAVVILKHRSPDIANYIERQ